MTSIQITGPRAGDARAEVADDGTVTITIPDRPRVEAATLPGLGAVPGAQLLRTPLRIGFHPTPAEYKVWLPKLPTPWFTRVFHPPGSGLSPWNGPATLGLPAATIRHISFKDRVAPGVMTAFFDSIPDNVPQVWVTWHHEGDINWAHDVAGYRDYWQLVRRTADAHPNRPKITLINVHTQYASRMKRSAMDWRDFMVPDAADVDSWDCYRPQSPDVYEAPETLLGLPLTAQREFGVRTHVTEYGTHPTSWDTDGSAQAQWYRESCKVMAAAGVEAVGFWCNIDGKLEYRPTKAKVLAEWTKLMNEYNSVPAP
jgi:hypothetical protein